MRPHRHQRGAALLLAMLMVTLVAVLASASLWQQWRAIEIERAQRVRLQAGWLLTGALDWTRLILREDGRANQIAGQPDHLGEPWALPLQEARLSSFLAAERGVAPVAIVMYILSTPARRRARRAAEAQEARLSASASVDVPGDEGHHPPSDAVTPERKEPPRV